MFGNHKQALIIIPDLLPIISLLETSKLTQYIYSTGDCFQTTREARLSLKFHSNVAMPTKSLPNCLYYSDNLHGIQYFAESNDQISQCSIAMFIKLELFSVDSAAYVKISFAALHTEIIHSYWSRCVNLCLLDVHVLVVLIGGKINAHWTTCLFESHPNISTFIGQCLDFVCHSWMHGFSL